jgi:hypothetical protein
LHLISSLKKLFLIERIIKYVHSKTKGTGQMTPNFLGKQLPNVSSFRRNVSQAAVLQGVALPIPLGVFCGS